MRISIWIVTLTLLSTSMTQAKEATYSCSLPPLTFKFYQLSDHYTYDIEVIRGDSVETTTQTMVDVQGSGPCRHGIWRFDYLGPITVRQLGCYGELIPPDNAVGEISFDSESDFKRTVYCY